MGNHGCGFGCAHHTWRAPVSSRCPLGKKNKENDSYSSQLRALQIELTKLHHRIIESGQRILILFEGRDAAGKDGTIKRIVRYLSPREVRVVALGKPSDRDKTCWYFQRYVPHLPAGSELVLFNRSWYNRAGVERVMGFCTDEEYAQFMETVPYFEQLLIGSGIQLRKYYLDITKDEQAERLSERREDPLKQWKISPIDAVAQEKWGEYSVARNAMLARTHSPIAPWTVVATNDKKTARLNVIRDLLVHLDYDGKDESILLPDADVVFRYDEAYLENGTMAP